MSKSESRHECECQIYTCRKKKDSNNPLVAVARSRSRCGRHACHIWRVCGHGRRAIRGVAEESVWARVSGARVVCRRRHRVVRVIGCHNARIRVVAVGVTHGKVPAACALVDARCKLGLQDSRGLRLRSGCSWNRRRDVRHGLRRRVRLQVRDAVCDGWSKSVLNGLSL